MPLIATWIYLLSTLKTAESRYSSAFLALFLYSIIRTLRFTPHSCKNETPKTAHAKITNAPVVKDSFYIMQDGDAMEYMGLNVLVNRKTIHLIDTSEHLYIWVDSVLDYDKDNDLDALIRYSESGGGNCCPDNFFLITNMGNGKYVRSAMTVATYHSPVFETWNGQNTMVVKTDDAGDDNNGYKEVFYRYTINNGIIKQVEAVQPAEIPALAEIKVSEFDSSEEIRELNFDLDGDGKEDTIECSIWERWNLMIPSFKFANGLVEDETGLSAKRIGVLNSKTNGVNDLVFDLKTIVKWDGKKYQPPNDSFSQ